MKIEKLQDITSQKGYKVNDQYFVAYEGNAQFDKDNKDYQSCLEFIKNDGIVLPEFTAEELLQRAKEAKLNELYRFHESNEVKYLTIRIGNLKTGIFVNQEYRYLIDEQRELLQIKKLKGDPNPTWNYVNGVTLPLTLDFLNNLRLYIGDLTDFNFKAKINNVKLINNLKTKDDVENFNVKNGYRFNQEFMV